jgi:hypothetical protein
MLCSTCGGAVGGGRCVSCGAVPERRHPARQRRIAGGARSNDPPLTTRDCADWMGLSTEWVRAAIDEGVRVNGHQIRLEAEGVRVNGRQLRRVHLDAFIAFLHAIGWRRVPRSPRLHAALAK